jgi:hypothetical protein
MQLELCAGSTEFVPEINDPWAWAKTKFPGALTLKAPYETGTLTLTNGLTSGTFSVAPAASLAGYEFRVSGRADFFRIATHVAATTAFTLDFAYTGVSGAGLAFTAYKLNYDLTANILRLIEPMRVYRAQAFGDDQDSKVYGIDPATLSKNFPLSALRSGVPTHFAVIAETNNLFTVRFNAIVTEDTRIEYDYVPTPTALTSSPDTTPLLPYQNRSILVNGPVFWLMIDKKDSRADSFFRLTQSGIQAMNLARKKQFAKTSSNYARLIPRTDQVDSIRRATSDSGFVYP